MFQAINGWTKERIIKQIQDVFTVKSVSDDAYHAYGVKCAYRGTGGAKCAVGIFIPDALYVPDMDNVQKYMDPSKGTGVEVLLNNFPVLRDQMPLEVEALQALQRIHDGGMPGRDPRATDQIKADMISFINRKVANG
jgi:hypothetical protein